LHYLPSCLKLERFYCIRNAVRKAVIDLKLQSSVAFSDEEIEQIRTVVQVLQVVKLTVEVLCRRDATLITADAALRFMLTKLRAENTNLSHDLANALSRRIRQRRNKLSGVLTYLHNPNAVDQDADDEDSDVFSIPPVTEIRKIIKELVQRLQASNDTGTQLTPDGDSGEVSNPQCEVMQTNIDSSTVKQLSVEQELQKAILASACPVINTPSISTSQELMKVIRQEMTLFENGGNRGRHLKLVYDYLLSIPPTSVEAERAFSASGVICSRLRTRLGDETLDALCFLRSYFQKQQASS
jgi:hAT family C-terminal dimerisation region